MAFLVIVLQALYFFLPSYISNGVPVLLHRWKLWEKLKKPIDNGIKFKGERLFGSTKTWRGLIGGVAGGLVVAWIQIMIYWYVPESHWLYIVPYDFWTGTLLGFLLGFGEGLGDLIKSFIKRRLHRKSSSPFFPFDQMSFLASLALSMLFIHIPLGHIVAILILSPLMPIIANIVAYKLGWKKVWW